MHLRAPLTHHETLHKCEDSCKHFCHCCTSCFLAKFVNAIIVVIAAFTSASTALFIPHDAKTDLVPFVVRGFGIKG